MISRVENIERLGVVLSGGSEADARDALPPPPPSVHSHFHEFFGK